MVREWEGCTLGHPLELLDAHQVLHTVHGHRDDHLVSVKLSDSLDNVPE